MNELKLNISVNDCDVNDVMNKLRKAFKGGNKMNAKITVPATVATAIRHYTDLHETKHEAFANILQLGYESERSEAILRHFDGDFDLLMEALICGYQVERSPEEKVAIYHRSLKNSGWDSEALSVVSVLDLLGIKIEGVNA